MMKDLLIMKPMLMKELVNYNYIIIIFLEEEIGDEHVDDELDDMEV